MKRIISLLTLFILSFQVQAGQTYALLIGVADYQRISKLTYTINDVDEFSKFLMSSEGGEVPVKNIYVLKDKLATKGNILHYGKHLFTRAGENDRVIFYFSGHGGGGGFCPVDFDNTPNKHLLYSDVKELFRNCKARSKVIFADACEAGNIKFDKKKMEEKAITVEETKTKDIEVAIMMSCMAHESSYESRQFKQGYFTYFLIQGMKKHADINGDKQVTMEELHKYVFQKTSEAVKKELNASQRPITFGNFKLNMVVSWVIK
jgi:uncharacterized caspase-like protein